MVGGFIALLVDHLTQNEVILHGAGSDVTPSWSVLTGRVRT